MIRDLEAAVLEVKDLHVAVHACEGLLEAVSGVSFSLHKGECFALVGESGCGKSLTALSLMRLLPESAQITAGSVTIDGENLLELPEKEMQSRRGARIAMIFQEPATSLNPVLTIGDQIVEAVLLHQKISKNDARSKALEWLERVGIDAPEKRFEAFSHELSGGQKQRVMIAMALACEPQVVVADEPTTALDVTLQAQILELLKRLQKERGIALLLITHDLAVVRQCADRVALMYAGQIVEENTAAEFFAHPQHPYARQLLAAVPSADKSKGLLTGIAGTVPELGAMPKGCRFAPRCKIAKRECTCREIPLVRMKKQGALRCLRTDSVISLEKFIEAPTAKPGDVVFEVQNLSVFYEKKRGILRSPLFFDAVKNVSLAVRAGQTTALVGESGSGKTTLAKAALGLLEDARIFGKVMLAGHSAYDVHGHLMRSTRNELYYLSLAGSKIDPDAFYNIVHEHRKSFFNKEEIAGKSFYSLYTPVINDAGSLIAIINIPYFEQTESFRKELISTTAAIINIFVIMIIVVVIIGAALTTSLFRPLLKLYERMEKTDLFSSPEKIDYDNNDEVSYIVKAYNRMIDNMTDSTRRFALSEREQAWRDMARQIAHEIKNPLTPMRLNIQHLLRMKQNGVPDLGDKLEKICNSLLEQIDVLADTATEFSSFAKFNVEESVDVDLDVTLREQIVLFGSYEGIDIEYRRAGEMVGETYHIFAPKSQMIRVFVNLLTNAVQALEPSVLTSSARGRIYVTLTKYTADQDSAWGIPGVRYVRVDVEDNGPGVSLENRSKLFTPKFTTKNSGSGLGLAICKSVVEQIGGTIIYSTSEELGGADFRVIVPESISA